MPLVRLYSCGSLLFHKRYLPGYCSLKWIPHQADRWPHCCQRHFLRQQKMDRISQCICDSMNFCGLSTRLTPINWLFSAFTAPFFAPALCGLRFDGGTVDAQIFQIRVRIEFLENAQKSPVIPPFAETAVYRLVRTESRGMSAQAAPLLASQNMALSNIRSSFGGLPVFARGIRSRIRSHCASLNSYRLVAIRSPPCLFLLFYSICDPGTIFIMDFEFSDTP